MEELLMKRQVLSVVLGLAVTAAAGSAFAAGADNRLETLNQGELLGQIVQDRVLSVSEGNENIFKGEEADIYAILEENDKLTGSVVEDKVLNAEEGTQTENENRSDSYAILEENDKLTGSVVEDKVKK